MFLQLDYMGDQGVLDSVAHRKESRQGKDFAVVDRPEHARLHQPRRIDSCDKEGEVYFAEPQTVRLLRTSRDWRSWKACHAFDASAGCITMTRHP